MKRYVFIDAQNTASTTKDLLGFEVNWWRLCKYLKERWGCEKTFLYSGIYPADMRTQREFLSLRKSFGCIVRSKEFIIYKNPSRTFPIQCAVCGTRSTRILDMGYRNKANCDVELTADVLGYAGPDTELMIFTADGDFAYLVEKAIQKGSIVKIVSHARKYVDAAGQVHTRFARRLREVISKNAEVVAMIDIARWRQHIEK